MIAQLELAVVFIALVSSMIVFDQLVRYEFSKHRDDWERDGKPFGFFFRPENSPFFRVFGGLFASRRCVYKWLFATPDWMHDDPVARRLINWYRLLTCIWVVYIVVEGVANLLFQRS